MRSRIDLRIVLALLCAAAPLEGQRGGRIPRGFDFGGLADPNSFYTPPDWRGNPPYDGRLTFARIKYRGYGRWSGREGPGWSHDYPDADVHLMTIVRELTAARPFTNRGAIIGGAIVALDDPALFKYPVAYLSEPGGWFPNADELAGLRKYIAKGGFIIVDDFNPGDWGTFESAMSRAFPALRPVELTGTEPIWDSFFKINMRQIRSGAEFGFGRRSGAFFGYYENNDPRKRMFMLVCYGHDIGESWQWSGQGFVPVDVSNEAFKLGINFLIYALTH